MAETARRTGEALAEGPLVTIELDAVTPELLEQWGSATTPTLADFVEPPMVVDAFGRWSRLE